MGNNEFGALSREAEASAQNTYATASQALATAQQFNNAKQPEIAHALTNFANAVTDAGNKSLSFIKRFGNRVGPQSIENTREFAKYIMGHGDEMAVDVTKTSIELTKALVLGKMLGKEYRMDPATAAKIDAFINHINEQIIHFKTLPLNEKFIEGAGLFADTILAGYLPGGFAQAAGAAIPPVAGMTDAIRMEHELSKQMKHIINATAEIVPESEAALHSALTPITSAITAALNTLTQNPELAGLADNQVDCIRLIAQNEKWSIKGLLHTCKGACCPSTKQLISGMHTWKGFEHFLQKSGMSIEEFSITLLPNGVRIIKCPRTAFKNTALWEGAAAILDTSGKRISGIKTIWPELYGPHEIRHAAIEIFSKPENFVKVQRDIYIFEGVTSEGIKAQIKVDIATGEIKTAYPLAF